MSLKILVINIKKSKSLNKLINANDIINSKTKDKEDKKINLQLSNTINLNSNKKNIVKNPNVLKLFRKRSSIDSFKSYLKLSPNTNIPLQS